MKYFIHLLLLLCTCISSFSIDNQVIWDINNLTSIGGNAVTVYGAPNIITSPEGNAIQFDGMDDRILVHGNPLGAATEFTIEIIFKPHGGIDPRFFHMEEPAMSGAKRITIECRFTGADWYLDSFMKPMTSGAISSVLHPIDEWIHVAMTYKDGEMKAFVNGVLETTTLTTYNTLLPGAQVSLGGRMNNVNYLDGAIRKVVFTPQAIPPSDFTYNGVTPAVNNAISSDVMKVSGDKLINPTKLNVEVFGVSGVKQISSSKESIEINNLRPGIYIVNTSEGSLKFLK